MDDVRFYWENDGNKYNFRKDRNYLIYFKGCFCCPTRGHFNVVKELISQGRNIKVMIHQTGSEKRHGIPQHVNQKIWRIYINELLPRDRIFLVQHRCKHDLLDPKYLKGIDRIVYVRGDEGQDHFATEVSLRRQYRHIVNLLRDEGIGMDFYFMARPLVNTLSASKFISSLLRFERGGTLDQYNRLFYFLPEGLSEDSAEYIIFTLLQYDLK